MRLNGSTVACLLAAHMLALGSPSTGQAQGAPAGSLGIGAEIGTRSYGTKLDPLSIGKFEEYRDMRARTGTSPLFEQLLLKYTPADSFGIYELSARKLFDRDQSAFFRAARPGEFDFQLRFDKIPHTYSTTARSPGDELGNPGFNTLPAPRPDSLAWRSGQYIGPLRSQWDPFKATLALTPTENLAFKADYTHIDKKGGIPRSMSFSGSSGPQREFVSPIDQAVSDIRISQDYASGDRSRSTTLPFIKSYQASVSYAYSMFQNAIKSTLVDNPQLSVSSFTSGTAAGRVSLEPSNAAQTLSATAAMLFPLRTRVTATLTSSWRRQNDAFLPQTSNDSLRRDPNYGLVGTLQRASLEGKARTSTYNFAITTHPLAKLTVSARTRSFDLSNQTAPFAIKAMVVSDRTVTVADSETFEAFPFTKTNTTMGATYEFARGLAMTGGYAWEDWARDPDVRNLETTSEKTPSVSFDYTALDWFSLRASYASGSRRGSAYTTAATEILNFRRFDEADRDRTRLTLISSVSPTDDITLSLTLQTGEDKFPGSQYGIVRDNSTMTGLDVDWSPVTRFTLSAGWVHEDVKDSANYRYRTGAVGSATYDNPTYRWMNTNKDRNTSYYTTMTVGLIPDKLDFTGTWSVTDSHWWMYNVNPTTPTGGTAAQNLSATAQDWPEVTQRMEPLSVSLRYRYSNEWAMTLRFQSERYQQTDFRTVAPVFTSTGLNGGTVTSNYAPGELPGTIGQVTGSNTGQYHFLGNNYRPYSVNWLSFMVSYQPSLLQWARGRSGL
jgi:MtrB/PioB family decaheme-associated outer membrane protein